MFHGITKRDGTLKRQLLMTESKGTETLPEAQGMAKGPQMLLSSRAVTDYITLSLEKEIETQSG